MELSEIRVYEGKGRAELGRDDDFVTVRFYPADESVAETYRVLTNDPWGDFERQAELEGVDGCAWISSA